MWWLLVQTVLGLHIRNRNHSWAVVHVNADFDAKTVDSLINVRHHVRNTVPIHIVTSQQERHNFQRLAGVFNLRLNDLAFPKTKSKRSYQRLLMSQTFWEAFSEEYLLIVQSDARFCHASGKHVEDFVGLYDYIGAPWVNQSAPSCVGNGGFSLRNRAAMISCCVNGPLDRNAQEDMAFSVCLKHKRFRLPTCELAASFAVETWVPPDTVPLGVHDAALYIDLKDFEVFVAHCPEALFNTK